MRMSKAQKAKTAKTKRSLLIKEWRQAWRFYSIICNTINTSVIATWLALPDDMRAAFPPKLLAGVVIVLLVAGSIGVILKQTFKP